MYHKMTNNKCVGYDFSSIGDAMLLETLKENSVDLGCM